MTRDRAIEVLGRALEEQLIDIKEAFSSRAAEREFCDWSRADVREIIGQEIERARALGRALEDMYRLDSLLK